MKNIQDGYKTEILNRLKTVGCIDTDGGIEELKYAEDRSFVYQRFDGTYERIDVEGAKITVDETPSELCVSALEMTRTALDKEGLAVIGVIFASEGVFAIDDEFDSAYLVKLPNCKILDIHSLIVSDYNEED